MVLVVGALWRNPSFASLFTWYVCVPAQATSLALLRYPSLNSHVNADCSQLTQKVSSSTALSRHCPPRVPLG